MTADQPKVNPAPPTPAERLFIHKVKNGWTLDVDYSAMRQLGDAYSTPGYVYTKATRLVSDVLGFLLNGKEAESDFVGKHLSFHAEPPVDLQQLKRDLYVQGRNSRHEDVRMAEARGFDRGHCSGYDLACKDQKANAPTLSECVTMRDELSKANQGIANVRAQRDEALYIRDVVVKERDAITKERDLERARLAELWPKVRTLECELETAISERATAYAKGFSEGEKTEHDKWYGRHPWKGISELEKEVKRINEERDQCRKELNDAYARGKHEGETNERDEARTECDRLTEKLNTVVAEGRMAWSKGRQSGIDFIMGMVKKHSAEYAEKWVGFFGGVE